MTGLLKSREELLKLTESLGLAAKSGFCSNSNCSAKTTVLTDAPSSALVYFGMPKDGRTRKICNNCLAKANRFIEKSKNLVKNKGNLFSLKAEVQLAQPGAVIVDLEPEDDQDDDVICVAIGKDKSRTPNSKDAASSDGRYYSVSCKTLDKTLEKFMAKFNIQEQISNCVRTIEEDASNLGSVMTLLDKQMNSTLDTISTTVIKLKKYIGGTQVVEMGTVDINEDGDCKISEIDNLTDQIRNLGFSEELPKPVADFRKTVNVPIPKALPPVVLSKPPVLSPKSHVHVRSTATEERSVEDTLFQSDTQAKQNHINPPVTVSRTHAVVFKTPKAMQMVYSVYGDMLNYWVPGKVIKITSRSGSKVVYTVQRHKLVNDQYSDTREYEALPITDKRNGKQIAFLKPSLDINLPVGSRIIARFHDILGNNVEYNGRFYAGIIAESTSARNNQRYLIFFDDGYSQYTLPSDVLSVVESSAKVWEDVHENTREFVKEYITRQPDRALLVPRKNDRLEIEYEGNILEARLVELDCSLMKVKYLKNEAGPEYEWLYRGSTRLCPIYEHQKKSSSNPKYKALNGTLQDYTNKVGNRSNKTLVRNTPSEAHDRFPVRKLSKSTSKSQNEPPPASLSLEDLERGGVMEKISITTDCPSPPRFSKHNCSTSCAYQYTEVDTSPYRHYNPLVIPFYLGWAREIRRSGRSGQVITYVSPCGIRLSSYGAIHSYNMKSKTGIPIEFFSLEVSIDCLNSFRAHHHNRFDEDISKGKEWTPVQCLNSLDKDLLPELDYISRCVVGRDVQINKQEEFLVCCDCDDDCKDKKRCACWQLTLSICKKEGRKAGSKGYQYRRLKDPVGSGIYECNKGCKCNVTTCFNRVVQSNVKWPVQVFKTRKKGWGVRTLHDMPRGSFLCCYTGQLLNDTAATEEGLKNGDDYLADLDFIECQEGKFGYESNCSDLSDTDECVQYQGSKPEQGGHGKKLQVARKSTSGMQRKKRFCETTSNTVSRIETQSKPTNTSSPSSRNIDESGKPFRYRKYFKEGNPYIIDGKKMGNFGRYFNHSCDPNVFIQNVFVDTHDLRFPWIAFFTKKEVKAGTELCWDYAYEIGSVPGKTKDCFCDTENCRGRLL